MKPINKYMYPLMAAICFGSFTALGRLALLDLNSQTIVVIRFSVLCLTILISLAFTKSLYKLKVKPKDIPLIGFMGITLILETLSFWYGLTNYDIIPLLGIYYSFPLMNYIIDVISKDVKLTGLSVVTILVGFIGVYLIGG